MIMKDFIEASIMMLKNADLRNKSNMIATITNTITLLETAIIANQAKDDGVRYENTFDDENPDYIKMSQEEI